MEFLFVPLVDTLRLFMLTPSPPELSLVGSLPDSRDSRTGDAALGDRGVVP
jgi:hypothetical protein